MYERVPRLRVLVQWVHGEAPPSESLSLPASYLLCGSGEIFRGESQEAASPTVVVIDVRYNSQP